ncbi:Translational repressor MPT5/PUF4 and related RNA-binding proteins (Puf superfamily) protein [Dioscorea alata]|uniref:Translational repressor MPT5/PUF4 and related RNA-binding proteins (Puf superfamily) protein n=1 Tax=Dioscorea alata TaxID=55571 RepID=A0ACB7TXI0_DIOAL|nr:Translational repressor MPT5/PUF4 and related RNA-binding proteins (Puf superfamily) protein [Dioscorea alata]
MENRNPHQREREASPSSHASSQRSGSGRGGITGARASDRPSRIHGGEYLHPFVADDISSSYISPRIHQQAGVDSPATGFVNQLSPELPSTSSNSGFTNPSYNDLMNRFSSMDLRAMQEPSSSSSNWGLLQESINRRSSYPSDFSNAGAGYQPRRSVPENFTGFYHGYPSQASYANEFSPPPLDFLANARLSSDRNRIQEVRRRIFEYQNRNMMNTSSRYSRFSPQEQPSIRATSQPPSFVLDELIALTGPRSPTTPNSQLEFLNLMEIKDDIHYLAKDRNYTQFFVKKLEGKDPQDVSVIFDGMFHHLPELMLDCHANLVVQTLMEVINNEQRTKLLVSLITDRTALLRASQHVYGTKAVQKLIEWLDSKEQIDMMIFFLKPFCFDFVKDPHSCHVVSQCLKKFSESDNQFILDVFLRGCVPLANNQSGCCVFQDCLRSFTGQNRINLIEKVTTNGLALSQDKYGNYVVQVALEFGIASASANLALQLAGHYADLSTDKCSSNVVEKCLIYFSQEDCNKIVRELLQVPQFEQLLQHPYANYVIQAALVNTEGSIRATLVQAILPHVDSLRTNPHSKGIVSKLLPKT